MSSLLPFSSLPGMTTERLEEMELRLKTDIIKELEASEGKIVIHREDPGTGTLVPSWWYATPESVKTIHEICLDLVEEVSKRGRGGRRKGHERSFGFFQGRSVGGVKEEKGGIRPSPLPFPLPPLTSPSPLPPSWENIWSEKEEGGPAGKGENIFLNDSHF
jgi:hypothetical protein